jgi:hypothetical protein
LTDQTFHSLGVSTYFEFSLPLSTFATRWNDLLDFVHFFADKRQPMKIKHIWRYPVKTMAGEELQRAVLGPLGIEGDRIVHIEDSEGGLVTSRSHPRFLGHKGSTGTDGIPLVDGRPWNSAEVASGVVDIAGPGAMLVRYEGAERFDVLPLLVATDGAIAAFGHDYRRLRPNIVIEGVEGMAEREWPGGCLRINKVLIGVQDVRLRCIMTSYDPDTQIQNKEITRGIYRRFEGKLALNCFVIEGGEIAIGDEVEVLRGRACTESAAPPFDE